MKLVKEILFEKFAEDTDPVHDLGIGGFKAVVQHIFDIDRKNEFIKNSSGGNINYIRMTHGAGRGREHVPGFHFRIHFFSNNFYDSNKLTRQGEPKRVVKLNYAKQLLDEAGILDYFSNIEYGDMCSYIVDCRIKENYRKFFIPGIYHDKEKLIENVNEKFEEQSDPITDLGIGLKPEEVLDKFTKDLEKLGFNFDRELVGHNYNTEYDEIYSFRFFDKDSPIVKLLFDDEHFELIFATTNRAAEHIIKGSKWGFFYWSTGTTYFRNAKELKEVIKRICKIRKISTTTFNKLIKKHENEIHVTKNIRDLLD